MSMSRQHHHIKCETEYFQAVEKWTKKFELRKNDRNYQILDIIYLRESVWWVLTGRESPWLVITYILHGGVYWLDPEYCILNW